jgi:trans-2,3-dihydro-3-hydroxyanthranilate isomerase
MSSDHTTSALRYELLDLTAPERDPDTRLAVFVDPGTLSDGQMQRIAAELGLPMCTFVWSPARRRGAWRTRTFTAHRELPSAGDAARGVAAVLAWLGHLPVEGGVTTVTLVAPVGTVEVDLTASTGTPCSVLVGSGTIHLPETRP